VPSIPSQGAWLYPASGNCDPVGNTATTSAATTPFARQHRRRQGDPLQQLEGVGTPHRHLPLDVVRQEGQAVVGGGVDGLDPLALPGGGRRNWMS
jgi:hypothetical protein